MKRTAIKRMRWRAELPEIRAWREEQTRCAACHRPKGQGWPPHSAHHLLNGRHGRPEDVRNLLLLCGTCHLLAELERIPHSDGGYWPVLTLAICLSLKIESDPENWDLTWLEQHHRIGKLPSRLPLPLAFHVERRIYATQGVA
jgi:hypothetical protein